MMTPEQIAARLKSAIQTIDYSLRWLDGDADAIADADAALCDLTELRNEVLASGQVADDRQIALPMAVAP